MDSIDCYDPKDDQWTRVATVPTPRYHTAIVAYNNKIYFIGGYHSDAMFDTAACKSENLAYSLIIHVIPGTWGFRELY